MIKKYFLIILTTIISCLFIDNVFAYGNTTEPILDLSNVSLTFPSSKYENLDSLTNPAYLYYQNYCSDPYYVIFDNGSGTPFLVCVSEERYNNYIGFVFSQYGDFTHFNLSLGYDGERTTCYSGFNATGTSAKSYSCGDSHTIIYTDNLENAELYVPILKTNMNIGLSDNVLTSYHTRYKTILNNDIYYNIGDKFYDENSVNGFYNPNPLPDEIPSGYKEVFIPEKVRYVVLSGISSGRVYYQFSNTLWGGTLLYYDRELKSQPYSSIISSYFSNAEVLTNESYVYYEFDLSTYDGADYMLFDKYPQLGISGDFYGKAEEKKVSYSIYVPEETFVSFLIPVENENGGYDYSYEVKDENGDIVINVVITEDLGSQSNTLFSVVLNFIYDKLPILQQFQTILNQFNFDENIDTAPSFYVNIPYFGLGNVEVFNFQFFTTYRVYLIGLQMVFIAWNTVLKCYKIVSSYFKGGDE